MIETQYLIHGEHTCYRIRSNPDGEAMDGSEGLVLEWKDYDTNIWNQQFFIAPEQAEQVARAILLFVTGKED
jgi:hypothetical protein